MTPAKSLRRSLLRKLAAPLSMLALMSGLIAYWLAWEYTERVVDRSMVDLASAIGRQVELSGPDAPRTVPPLTHAMFSDPTQQLIYRVSRGNQLIAGDPALPLHGTRVRHMRYAYVFDARYGDSLVRVAQVRVEQVNGDAIIIEVGQHVTHGYQIAAEFLVAIMMPLLILLFAGWAIVWRVVNQQLNPLTDLADSLNRQTHRSLEPVDETHVPLEIRPLTRALNALLDRLKAALDAQRKFIADAAHQLRTPLTAVKLHAEQASVAKDNTTLRLALHELRTSADRAVRLSNQLLSLARAEPEEQNARFVDIDLTELAFDTGAEWVPRALAAQLDLGFHSDPPPDGKPLIVRGNPVLLREVIGNLIDNALKYVPPTRPSGGGTVTVTVGRVDALCHDAGLADDRASAAVEPAARAPEAQPPTDLRGWAEVVVEDNGPGVPKALHADLFKRFFRGDAQTGSEGPTGAGLGLAIVRDIIALHGGSVHYEDAPDGGARFIVRLPLPSSHKPGHDNARPEPAH
ncbi:sensor histidine kinase N-terminal domain-containing protein [Mycetohabitans rhizoxinica]|uniref:histidine kinase n=2 Tax=Mycetohabitans rhizoxinica TaxID=412963 RepID=A0ABZ2PTI8_9BURK